MDLVFATNNMNKLSEVQSMLNTTKLKTLKDIGCLEDIPETASTIEGNAILKAQYVTEKYGKNCFADDTGLEVFSLNNAPGVYSARYAGPQKNAEDNMNLLLKNLSNIEDRSAQFKTVIALKIDKQEYLFEGICKGKIISDKRGKKGFGYDPIFIPDGYTTTFAEMTMEEKAKISHRGIATRKLIAFLNNYKGRP